MRIIHIHDIIEDEVIDINSGVGASAIAKSRSNCIVPEIIIDIINANHPDVKNISITIGMVLLTWYKEIEFSDQMVQIISMA